MTGRVLWKLPDIEQAIHMVVDAVRAGKNSLKG
jgi:hypothetical protein